MIDRRAFGLATGTVFGLSVAVLAWSVGSLRWGERALAVLNSVYPGYRPSLAGGLLGSLYGFLDGFAGGWAVAALYNLFRRHAATSTTRKTTPSRARRR